MKKSKKKMPTLRNSCRTVQCQVPLKFVKVKWNKEIRKRLRVSKESIDFSRILNGMDRNDYRIVLF